MENLTIRPLLKFMESLKRDYMCAGDWEQLENKLKNQLRAKKSQGQPTAIDLAYLEIIRQVTEEIAGRVKVANTEIISRVNNIITRSRYAYRKQVHTVRHKDNVFYVTKERSGRTRSYDLAFYHPQAPAKARGHHEDNAARSVYYMRCEERGTKILIGNMQIDPSSSRDWESPEIARIMCQPKNIYRSMVQEALKHALQRGKTEIAFQCGDANEITQWVAPKLKYLKVTKNNYDKIYKNYLQAQKKFGPEGIQKGTRSTRMVTETWCVVEKGPKEYKLFREYVKMNLIFNEILRADIPGVDHATRQKLKRAKKAFHQHIPALVKNIKAQKPKQTLAALEKLVAGVSEQSVPLHKPAQKIAQLKSLKYQGDNIYYVLDELKNFISDWGYDELLMKKFAFLRKVRIPQAEGPDDLIYYNHKDTSRTKIVRKKDLHIPQIGQSYLVPVEAPG